MTLTKKGLLSLTILIMLPCAMNAAGERLLFAANDTIKTDSIPADSVVVVTDSLKNDSIDAKTDSVKKKEETPYEKLIKEGGSVREGLFTVRHIKDDWYWEVPDNLLGRMLLAVTRFISVPQDFRKFSGEEVNRSAIYFEKYNDKTLFLREYVQSSYAKSGDRIAISLKQSTVDPIIQKFEIIGRNPDSTAMLIKVTPWLMSDNKVTSFSNSDRSQLNLGGLMNDRTFIDSIKTYPINIEIQSMRTYGVNNGSMPTSQTGVATLSLNTSIVLLPEVPMQARYEDERVGYFNNRITEFSDEQQTTNHEAIIMRYRLVPKDVEAYKAGKLVEPRKQIVYYIDPATPTKWVKYLKLGIDDWNKAFEAAGFKNAIVAKDWPENDSTMSVDDARFSMIRYLPSETENAYGPRIVDPRSGEIIEAHVCWYHNVMNLLKKWYMIQCGPNDKRARSMKFDDELMGQLIRFVSSHEVGHALGLRHNMIASQATPVEKLRDKAWVEKHGHTSSIMDYARFNYVAQPEDNISEKGLFPRINDYDCWAIKWGYQYRPEFKGDPAKEKKVLRSEVTKKLSGNRRLWWCGDEGWGGDPRSQTEDLGDNQMKANEYGIKNLKRVMENIEKWTEQPDGQYEHLEEIYDEVRSQYSRYFNHVNRYLTGHYTNNAPKEQRYDYVPKELAKEALEWIDRNVMVAPMWLYPKELIQKTGVNYTNEISNRQANKVRELLGFNTIGDIINAHMNSPKAYDPEEYLNDVFAIVWKPLDKDNEEQNYFIRQQQRAYVEAIGGALNPSNNQGSSSTSSLIEALLGGGGGNNSVRSDAILYFEQHLDKVEQYLKAQQADGTNGLHYKNLLLRIKKIREKYESGK